jgi:ActR/RegA family two-component response regulator
MSQEERDLATHVEICAIRYKAIEERYDAISDRLTKVEIEVGALKSAMQSGFSDIKLLLEKQNNSRTIQIIATFGSIAVAVIGVMGYLITH